MSFVRSIDCQTFCLQRQGSYEEEGRCVNTMKVSSRMSYAKHESHTSFAMNAIESCHTWLVTVPCDELFCAVLLAALLLLISSFADSMLNNVSYIEQHARTLTCTFQTVFGDPAIIHAQFSQYTT